MALGVVGDDNLATLTLLDTLALVVALHATATRYYACYRYRLLSLITPRYALTLRSTILGNRAEIYISTLCKEHILDLQRRGIDYAIAFLARNYAYLRKG
jgi:hypothetical protein